MSEKIYSICLKNQRFDFTQSDLDSIRKGTTKTEGGRQFVHVFTKNGRVDVLKEEFDAAISKVNSK